MNKYNIGDTVYNKEGYKGKVIDISLHIPYIYYKIISENGIKASHNREDSLGFTKKEAILNEKYVYVKSLEKKIRDFNKEIVQLLEEINNVKIN